MDFGDYCYIEQKRYGVENEIYRYKVIGSGQANYYRIVPVDHCSPDAVTGESCAVVKAICCGIDEIKVETFRLQDVSESIEKVEVMINEKSK